MGTHINSSILRLALQGNWMATVQKQYATWTTGLIQHGPLV